MIYNVPNQHVRIISEGSVDNDWKLSFAITEMDYI